jgi:hypothetical protein
MNKKATLLLPTRIEIDLEEFDLTLGELIKLPEEYLDDPSITPENFGVLKLFFFVNSSTGSLINSVLDLGRPLSTLFIEDRNVVELRLSEPDPERDGRVLTLCEA